MAGPNRSVSLQSSVVNASDMFIECFPCKRYRDSNLDAHGYCSDCQEHLCEDCFKNHCKPSPTRHHTLVDKTKMPYSKPSSPMPDILREVCPNLNHHGNLVEHYCQTHYILMCKACLQRHMNCKVDYIPNISKHIVTNLEYQKCLGHVKNLQQSTNKAMNKSKEIMKLSITCQSDAMKDYKEFRKDVLEALDTLEETIRKKSEEMNTEDKTKLSELENKIEEISKQVQEIDTKFSTLQENKQNCEMFIYMKQKKAVIESLEQKLSSLITDQAKIKTYTFQRSTQIQDLLKRPKALGTLEREWEKKDIQKPLSNPRKWKAHYLDHHDINIKSNTDNNLPIVTGSVTLPDNKLAIVDFGNNKVKLIDLDQGNIKSEHDFSSSGAKLCDITQTGINQLAVTSHNKKRIFFLKVGDNLEQDREIKVNGECSGIACSKNRLVVSFRKPAKVEVIDMSGKVLCGFLTDDRGDQLFSSPYYLGISPVDQTIYVSDWEKHVVISLGMDGRVKAIYKDNDLKNPRQLVVDNSGTVLVCGQHSKNIHVLTPDCKKVKILLTQMKKSEYYSFGLSADSGKLYLAMWKSEKMEVYQLK